jgi:hypothetical protein
MPYIKANDPILAGLDTNCIICRNTAVVCWVSHSGRTVCACVKCATEDLPMLIAEVATAKNPEADLDGAMQTVAESFYRGAALGLQRSYKCAITPPIPRR